MIRKILIAGAGNMGAWLAETMCREYEVAGSEAQFKDLTGTIADPEPVV